MKEKITQRFTDLIEQGKQLIGTFVKERHLDFIKSENLSMYQAWLSSIQNLIFIVTKKGNPFFEEFNRLITHNGKISHITPEIIRRALGLIISAQKEWSEGMLGEIEYIYAAETFDDFLDHADKYHKLGKKKEAGILASAVLEDVIAKIAKKNNIEPKGKSLEPLIDELTKSSIFTTVKARRIKSYAGTRTKAFHAEWDEFDIKDVGEMIKGLRELIEDYL